MESSGKDGLHFSPVPLPPADEKMTEHLRKQLGTLTCMICTFLIMGILPHGEMLVGRGQGKAPQDSQPGQALDPGLTCSLT